ncbi:MAG: LPS export ABC transporter permease LptF [Rhodospirillales bacterium]|nr:LPS export ABC transporter permease LptF [Rhodospirillales bacterium]
MNGLTRYIFWQLFVGLALVATSLSCVVWLTQSLRFVDMIVNRGLSAGMFIFLTGLMMPNFLTIIFPVSLFAIVTFTYHRMIMDRELVVMRAAGLGPMSLSKPAIILSMLTVVLGYVLSTYIVPTSYTQFREMQWDIRYSFSHVLLREGTFNEAANGVTVYVRERTDDGQLLGVLAHDDRNDLHSFTLMSERGAMVQSDEGAKVVMFNGSRQDFDKQTKQLTILYFDRYVFELEAPTATGEDRHREPRERSMAELLDLDTTGLDENTIGKFHVEFHRRLALPWSALSFVMITLSVLMSGSFSRRGEGRRVFAAILLAAGYQGALLAILDAAAKNEALLPTVYIVALLPTLIGVAALMLPGWRWRARVTPGTPSGPISGPISRLTRGTS